MAKPSLDRDNQMAQIIASAAYQSGEAFTSPVIASLLCCTVSQARDLCGAMVVHGLLTKHHERRRQGGARTGTIVFQRPPPTILRKPWRKIKNSELGIADVRIGGNGR